MEVTESTSRMELLVVQRFLIRSLLNKDIMDVSEKDQRNNLYQFALSKLIEQTNDNLRLLENHLYRLKVNQDYVITTENEIEELVEYINQHGEK
ncbi:hypothetical protein GCQ56_03475 [Marinifilum sp. N1E240]|uniref:hypothetical protein n=1 Tax=Marinifilum sp. N1E240 TaxID=2608082 RepID=UPI00128B4A30|nr:hypothetical protein [Marinifilum sp. N1E240]MPQ46060.1 hypothetical protein [Marinifilum sp. N1E240]